MLQNNPVLRSKIDELWKKFWAGGISNPLTAIEQITFLLFVKRMDILDSDQQYNADFLGENFKSRFVGPDWIRPSERDKEAKDQRHIPRHTLRWSSFTRMKPDEMLSHVRDNVFEFLKDLNGEESHFTHHMKNAVFIIPKPSLLVEAVKTIDEIFVEMERDAEEGGQTFQDIQGDVYEYLLSEIATAGKNGQFRTPRHIIKLVTELVAPEYRLLEAGGKIADPACGSSGFLLGAYQYIISQLAKSDNKELVEDEDGFQRAEFSQSLTKERVDTLSDSLFGFDIDQSMVRMGLMNLMMHGIDEPNVDYQDTLSKNFNQEREYQYIFANPPFTGNLDKSDINSALKLTTTKTELLFIENIYRMLRKGGTAGVIIPQGVLFGSSKAFINVRKLIMERCQLKAVVSMPSGVFKPYAGVSTAILLFTKVYDYEDEIDSIPTKNTFFYDMVNDGYSMDDKRAKQKNHGDLQDIIQKYQNQELRSNTDRKEKYFSVPFREIKAERYNLSFNRYKEEIIEEVNYGNPSDILNTLILNEIGITPEIKKAREDTSEKLDELQQNLVEQSLNRLKLVSDGLEKGILKDLVELKGMIL